MYEEILDIDNPIDFYAWKKLIIEELKRQGKKKQIDYIKDLSPLEFYFEKEKIISWINEK